MPSDKIVKLCGDKGYISKKRFKLNNRKRIKIIALKRRNQLIDTSKEQIFKKKAIC